ncbi:MAG: baseplate J/gp47 family protein [Intestinimonas sp.]|nr:MAG TPA: Baseplate J like protein [Caudoviricetes sp.]
MIDHEILDQIIPVPELEDLKEETVAELKDAGFAITNFHSGGIFHTLLMIALRIQIELLELARTILNQSFVSHASGTWLDLKMADYSKLRKQARKTRGYVTVSRTGTDAEAVKIAKGHIFKSVKDINGEELRFFALEDTVLQKGAQSVDVLVEAETEGSRYNVPEAQITRTLTYIGEVEITNGEGWITQEGSDTEDDESARTRTLRAWSELALVPLRDTYVNVCEAISGVLYVTVNDQHPRGQGTVDVIVTSEAGAASEDLLAQCRAVCEAIREPDTDVLVKSAEIVYTDINVTVTISNSLSREGLSERVKAAVTDLLRLRGRRVFNELTHADLIHKIKSDVSVVRNVTVTAPAEDLFLATDKVILPGTITVSVEGV